MESSDIVMSPSNREKLGDPSITRPDLLMSNIKGDNSDQYPPKLSPTPRKSERDRKNISYAQLNKGQVDSFEENPGQDSAMLRTKNPT